MDSARAHQNFAELGAVLSGIAGVAFLVFGAYQTYRKGMKVSATKTITGTPAKVMAAAMLVAAVAVGVVAALLWLGKIHF
jgi:hypothetical protein